MADRHPSRPSLVAISGAIRGYLGTCIEIGWPDPADAIEVSWWRLDRLMSLMLLRSHLVIGEVRFRSHGWVQDALLDRKLDKLGRVVAATMADYRGGRDNLSPTPELLAAMSQALEVVSAELDAAPEPPEWVIASKADVVSFLAPQSGDRGNTKLADRAEKDGRFISRPAGPRAVGKRALEIRFTDPGEHAEFWGSMIAGGR